MKNILLVLSCISISHFSYGTHIRAGEIVATQLDCRNEFTITVIIYANTNSSILPGDGILNFGDGSNIIARQFTSRPDLPPGAGVFSFTVGHTYASSGSFIISYQEPNRNAGILNIQNSFQTPFFIETAITVNPLVCNNSPVFFSPPIDKACRQLVFYHNPGGFDRDGDSLSYLLVIPKSSVNQSVGYTPPNHPSFYGPDFNTGNEDGNGQPRFEIDPLTGTIFWDAPGNVGEYSIAFVVEEWRKIEDVFVRIGSVRRDMQIVVEECNNRCPGLEVPVDICVFAGTPISEIIRGADPDNHDIKLEAFSGIFALQNNPGTLTPFPPVFQPSGSQLLFSWTPDCMHVRNQPYQITFKVTDNPPSGPSLVRFKVWNIKVMAPPPMITQTNLDVVNRKIEIVWAPYGCTNASKIIVWRRVGSYQFNPDVCTAGLPKFAGYKKVAELAPDITKFTDDNNGEGLAVGAVYCYRITAVFPLAGGAGSMVSSEVCTPPILADAPVITHVTVLKTDETEGKMIISWRSPYDLSKPEYLKPYQYVLLRAKGLADEKELTPIQSVTILDTTFTDTGLDTKNFAYNYRIILRAKTASDQNLVTLDTSSMASSVWNSYTPRLNSIELNWVAETPWSNADQSNPWHLIYRRGENSTDNELVLIDSVNVLENGFTYVDEGKYKNQPLNESEFYYYRIMTRGTYGNPNIQSPIDNYSQILQATVLDTTPPCKPVMIQAGNDCDSFNATVPCGQKIFNNAISWIEPDDDRCRKDTYRYQVYAANSADDEFILIGSTNNLLLFIEPDLQKRARCYKIAAVDRAGNISELSEPVCFDNCPSIYFPNVFTPNDDEHNPYFTTFNTDPFCTRFVNHISLSIYNRWGLKVVEVQDLDSVKWDGSDGSGKIVPSGVYFFSAHVFFDVNDPAKKISQINGWVQVVR